jgi:hypothetical protein
MLEDKNSTGSKRRIATVRTRYYLTTLLAAGAAAATIGPATLADANPGDGNCSGYCGYSTVHLDRAPTPTQHVAGAFYPSMVQLPSTSHVLPVVDASGAPIHHP